MWVTATSLSTALNTAYMAESVATFAIVMGLALLLAGIGGDLEPAHADDE